MWDQQKEGPERKSGRDIKTKFPTQGPLHLLGLEPGRIFYSDAKIILKIHLLVLFLLHCWVVHMKAVCHSTVCVEVFLFPQPESCRISSVALQTTTVLYPEGKVTGQTHPLDLIWVISALIETFLTRLGSLSIWRSRGWGMWCLSYPGEENPESCQANLRYFPHCHCIPRLTGFSHYKSAVSGDLSCLAEFSMDLYFQHTDSHSSQKDKLNVHNAIVHFFFFFAWSPGVKLWWEARGQPGLSTEKLRTASKQLCSLPGSRCGKFKIKDGLILQLARLWKTRK